MNNINKKNPLVGNLIMVLAVTLYFLYAVDYLPLLMFLVPLPFIMIGISKNIETSLGLMATVALAFTGIGFLSQNNLDTSSTISGVWVLITFFPFIIATIHSTKKKKSNMETTMISFGVLFATLIIIVLFEQLVNGINIADNIKLAFEQILQVQTQMFSEMGLSTKEASEMHDLLSKKYKEMLVLLPAILAIFAFVISYINVFFAYKIVERKIDKSIRIQKFYRFKLPENALAGIALIIISTYIIGMLKISYHEALLVNLTFLITTAFFIQGLAVLDYFFMKLRIKSGLRTILITLNIIFLPISNILFFLGIFDSALDIRKLRKKKSH